MAPPEYIRRTGNRRGTLLSSFDQALLDERQVGEEFNISPRTLQNWRYARRGPVFYRVGRKILYTRGDVESWLSKTRVDCVQQASS